MYSNGLSYDIHPKYSFGQKQPNNDLVIHNVEHKGISCSFQ